MVEVREASIDDIEGILSLQTASYPTLAQFSAWRAHHLAQHQARFAPGQLVAVEAGRVVGFSASFIARSHQVRRPHTFREVTAMGTFEAHDPDGDTLYGAEMMVHPDMRERGIGRQLYNARFELARRLGLRYFVAGGRLPGYAAVAREVTIEDYVQSVVEGRRIDRVLTPQLRNGLRVEGILPGYLQDPNSLNYAALLVWENTDVPPRPAAHRAQHGATSPMVEGDG